MLSCEIISVHQTCLAFCEMQQSDCDSGLLRHNWQEVNLQCTSLRDATQVKRETTIQCCDLP